MVFVHSKTLQYSTQSTPSLISFPNVAFKTILMFVWTALFALKSLTLYRPCFPQPEQHISLERLPGLLFAVGDLPFLQNCLSWSPWCYTGPVLPTWAACRSGEVTRPVVCCGWSPFPTKLLELKSLMLFRPCSPNWAARRSREVIQPVVCWGGSHSCGTPPWSPWQSWSRGAASPPGPGTDRSADPAASSPPDASVPPATQVSELWQDDGIPGPEPSWWV